MCSAGRSGDGKYHIPVHVPVVPNERDCLNKCAPRLLTLPAISQEPLNVFQSNLEDVWLTYRRGEIVNFIEIGQGLEFFFCLRTWRVYLALDSAVMTSIMMK